MSNQVQDVLFEYLRQVIYEPEEAQLDIESLPEKFHDLGEGLVFLGKCVREQKLFGKSLISGDFESNIPDVENGIAAPLKEVHGILRHLVWQSQEVAKGDYSQRLAYFGDLSEAFNSMVQQLKEREDNLRRKNRELMNIQEMLKNITSEAPYYIIAFQGEENAIAYTNKSAKTLQEKNRPLFDVICQNICDCHENDIMTIDDPHILPRPNHYRVMTTSNQKDETRIYMVMNATDELSKTLELEKLAYLDELTGLHNRRYAQDTMYKLKEDNRQFAVAFVDLDHLKYCNDEFGHEKGDEYIKEVCDCLMELPGEKIICRVGGDEFTLVRPEVTKEELTAEIDALAQIFTSTHRQPFTKSFSYGVEDHKPGDSREISEILTIADCNMYQYKIKHKQKIQYEDDRLL